MDELQWQFVGQRLVWAMWPTNDARSALTWQGRLDNFQNAAVYNFYSSGEEVLRDYPGDPPTSLIGIAVGQLYLSGKATRANIPGHGRRS